MEKRPKAKRAPGERSAKRPIDREWDHGFRTALGPIVIRWREGAGGPLVTRIFLPAEPAPGGARRGAANGGRRSCARIDALSRRIAAFCAGKAVSLGRGRGFLDLGAQPRFGAVLLVPGFRAVAGLADGDDPFDDPVFLTCQLGV